MQLVIAAIVFHTIWVTALVVCILLTNWLDRRLTPPTDREDLPYWNPPV